MISMFLVSLVAASSQVKAGIPALVRPEYAVTRVVRLRQEPAAGPNLPTTLTPTQSLYPGQTVSTWWSNPTTVESSTDGAYASTWVEAKVNGDYLDSYVLYTSGYGFSLPSSAVVDSFDVTAKAKTDVAYNIDGSDRIKSELLNFKLIKAGSLYGTGEQENFPTTSWSTFTVPHPNNNLWAPPGEGWSASDVNASSFGVALWAEYVDEQGQDGTARNMDVDWVAITVSYHTVPSNLSSFS